MRDAFGLLTLMKGETERGLEYIKDNPHLTSPFIKRRKTLSQAWFCLFILVLFTSPLLAVENARPAIAVPFFDSEPILDGRIEEAVWRHATTLKDFYQTQPGDNTSPTHPTEILLGYNEKSLFIGVRASDDPRAIRATLANRDAITNDDYISIYLDTFDDQRKAYVIMVNPLGIQQDGIFVEDGNTDFSVDVVMDSKGILTENGYTIEISVPFYSFRHQTGEKKDWGIHVLRVIKHLDEENSWRPLKRNKVAVLSSSGSSETKAAFLSQAGRITGFEGIRSRKVIDLIPVMTPSETGRRIRPIGSLNRDPSLPEERQRFLNQPVDVDLGLTAKLALNSSTTLTGAWNPDFAEVEADQPQLTANQRFPLFFEEKRPFFLEGIEIFRTPIQAVHTRTIVDPNMAVKLSGKHNQTSFGLMLASDEALGNFSDEDLSDPALLPTVQRFVNQNAYSALFRLRQDLPNQSSLGVVATSYNFIDNHNHAAGFDGRLSLNPHSFLSFQILGTTTRQFFYDPELDQNIYRTGNGLGYYSEFNQTSRNLTLQLVGQGYTPDYRAELGFTSRTDTNRWSSLVRYNSEPKMDAKLISWSGRFIYLAQFDWEGRMQYSYYYPSFFLNFKRQTHLNLHAYVDYIRAFEEEFGPARTETRPGAFSGAPERSTVYKGYTIDIGTAPDKRYSLSFVWDQTWDYLDYDFGAGPKYPRVSPAALADPDAPLDPGPGNTINITGSATYQPSDAWRFSFDYNRGKLVRNDTKLTAFEQNLYTIRANYSFNSFTFARARIDYDSLSARITGEALFGWTPNPGTAIYVGYNDNLNYNGYNPYTHHYEHGLQRNIRTFFVKLSYLFRREL